MADFTGDDRNEFLLMGDILGVSQLVEEVNHQVDGVENKFALVGPFYEQTRRLEIMVL